MAESTKVYTRLEGTITFAALGGGAYNKTTGALESGANEYTVAIEEGNGQFTPPSRGAGKVLDRGRTASVPDIYPTDDVDGSFTLTAYLRNGTSDSDDTLMDIGMFVQGVNKGSVGTNWESTSASSAGAGDSRRNSIAIKLDCTNEGNASDTAEWAANYCTGTITVAEGEPNTIQISLVIHDKPEDFILV